MKPYLILGVGNLLLKDEGVGVHVVDLLLKRKLPDYIEVLDGGTSGADLVDVIANRAKVVVIDATEGDGEPGTLYRFTVHDLVRRVGSVGSLHEFGFLESYLMSVQLKCPPAEVVIIGVQPNDVHLGLELSQSVTNQLPKVIELVLYETILQEDRHVFASPRLP